jgi:hypothetical protein
MMRKVERQFSTREVGISFLFYNFLLSIWKYLLAVRHNLVSHVSLLGTPSNGY